MSGPAFDEEDYEEDEDEEDEIPDSNFAVLDTSLPGHADGVLPPLPSTSVLCSPLSVPSLLFTFLSPFSFLADDDDPSINLNSFSAAKAAASSVVPPPSNAPAPSKPSRTHKPRWHFGIRSRSPPMEVMLEIYRTLKSLGMEWRKKPEALMKGPLGGASGGDGGEGGGGEKKKAKKDYAAEEKLARGLFFVETRCRVRDVVVRMDLQLYRVDSQNYLVDFRNVGYYRTPSSPSTGFARLVVPPSSSHPPQSTTPFVTSVGLPVDESPQQSSGGDNSPPRQPESPTIKEGGLGVPGLVPGGSASSSAGGADKAGGGGPLPEGIQEVCSPFLFLDCACRLIVEL
jgi:carbon catabolite-derepressing protein kinase